MSLVTINISADVAEFSELLNAVIEKVDKIMATLDEVLAKVKAQDTELDSVRELVAGLRQQVKDALSATGKLSAADQAKVDEIFAQADKNSAEIAESLAENVPVPTPPVNPI